MAGLVLFAPALYIHLRGAQVDSPGASIPGSPVAETPIATTDLSATGAKLSSPVFVAGWSSPRRNAGSGTTTQSVTICNLAGGCKAGDTIVVNYWQCCTTAQSLSNVTDNQGNVYREIVLANGPNGNNVFADLWGTASLKTSANSLTLTVTVPDTSHYRAIFAQQYRNVLGFGATHFTGQSNGGTVSESLTTTGSNSLVAVSFDIGFMTGLTQTGGPVATMNFSYDDNANRWGLFLWDSAVVKTGAYAWTWSSSGVNSTFESVAIELK